MNIEFEKWLVSKENKSPIVAHRYRLAISSISRHYSEQIRKETDLYKTNDIAFIKNLVNEYGINGKYHEIGNKGKGSYRYALSAYVRFLKYKELYEEKNNIGIANTNLIYESNIKHLLAIPISVFFPNYKEIENTILEQYRINEKEADILLENIKENNLILIKIIEGIADFNTFFQTVNYYGLLSDEFPEKNIKCIIIGNEIDESLVKACSITDKIEIMRYKINIKLEKFIQDANGT